MVDVVDPADDTIYLPLISNKRPGDDIIVDGQSATLPHGLGLAYAIEGISGPGASWYGGRELKQQVWDLLRPQCYHNWGIVPEQGARGYSPMIWRPALVGENSYAGRKEAVAAFGVLLCPA